MKEISCILVEDELPAIEEFIYMLKDYRDFKILEVFKEGMGAYNAIKILEPQVVFLDINIPNLSGIDLAIKIIELQMNIKIVFITSCEQHAIKAFEIDALDYILKPFDKNRVDKTVRRIRENLNAGSNPDKDLSDRITHLISKLDEEKGIRKIPFNQEDKIVLVDIEDLFYCYVEGEKTYGKTRDKLYQTRFTLSELENKTGFFRCHKSFIVNTKRIVEMYPWFNGTYQLAIGDKDNSLLPLSRSNVKKLKSLIGL